MAAMSRRLCQPCERPQAGCAEDLRQDFRAGERLTRILSWCEGAAVADVGAGTGRFTLKAAQHVGSTGHVFASDIEEKNWTGAAALVIVSALLSTSSDVALRALKARPWKWVQRLTYVLFALVVLHAFFYGALLRRTSPFTLLLIFSVSAVFIGQVAGIWLWRRRYVRGAA